MDSQTDRVKSDRLLGPYESCYRPVRPEPRMTGTQKTPHRRQGLMIAEVLLPE